MIAKAFDERWCKPLTAALASILALLAILTIGAGRASADVNTFTLIQPLNNATVRETVPIRVPRAMLNQASYATVTIDGQFRGAQAVPGAGTVIYRWNTKGSATTSGQSAQEASAPDGSHTILVSLFDKDSNEVARATSTVRVLNNIVSLPDGVHLAYKWHPDEVITYTFGGDMKRTDEQDANATDASGAPLPAVSGDLQSVSLHFDRSVEDMSSDGIMLRDHVLDNGTVTSGGSTMGAMYPGQDSGTPTGAGGTPIQSVYDLASKYWTVDSLGDVVVDNKPIAGGDHFGFPITQLPPRRVNIGDSWQCDIMASLQWSTEHLTVLHGQARLDSFEWQDGYPTAKITESYSGPAKFTVESSQGDLPPINADSVNLTRTVWFAYEAGMVVRSVTTMNSVNMMGSDQIAALGASATAAGPQEGGMPPMGMPPMGMPPGFNPGQAMGRAMGGPRFGFPGGAPGAPYIPNNPIVSQAQQQAAQTSVKIESDSTIDLSSVGSS